MSGDERFAAVYSQAPDGTVLINGERAVIAWGPEQLQQPPVVEKNA